MLIQELTKQASLDVLAHTSLGRLACCRQLQPYVVPFNFAYQDNCLYSFSMPGQKIAWMRDNPLVCVEADQMRREQWRTVVAFGRYEELPDTVSMRPQRALAVSLLQQRATWWEPGSVKMPQGDSPSALAPVFYRIDIVRITGRRGHFEPGAAETAAEAAEGDLLHRLLRRVRRR